VQVAGLRKKLGDFGHYIQTVRGVGYRFKDA
jgi:two-component system alkaline phosphatase synthesis response regulator PhoP